MSGPRVVVVGARRKRQGTGPFVARSFAKAGAEVVGIVGTSADSLREAGHRLETDFGLRPAPYLSLHRALLETSPDIVAICSPFRHHREQLQETARAGVHCLCEKPLLWEHAPGDPLPAGEEIVRAFADRGRHLGLLAQWPFTLTAFHALWPEERDRPTSRFSMRLCPAASGPRMVLDALPHVISMLMALGGSGRAEGVKGAFTAGGDELRLSFAWVHRGGTIETGVHLTRRDAPPRPASYAVNDREVERLIEMPGYEMSMVAGARRVSLADPLELRVRAFLDAVARGEATDGPALLAGLTALRDLTRAAETWHKQEFPPRTGSEKP